MLENILEVKNLNVKFASPNGKINAVRNVSFQIGPRKTLGLVGESGCGKSVTVKSILRLHNEKTTDLNGEVLFNSENLLKFSPRRMTSVRGNEISMIFQDPMTSLNPLIKVGKQVAEVIQVHEKIGPKRAREQTIALFESVGITSPEQRYSQFPHEFSGGMQQRIMIAIALACHPQLLLADEPTTALDVTIQAQILKLMQNIQEKFNMSILMITHDLGVVAGICDDVAVMYAGEIVEYGSVRQIFGAPGHPYTIGLLQSIPKVGSGKGKLPMIEGIPPKLTAESLVGCPFADRCTRCMERCRTEAPPLTEVAPGHQVVCHLYPG